MRRTCVLLALALVFPLAADEARSKAIHDATVLVDEGKVDEAIDALKKLVAGDPADTLAVYELGLAYAAKGDNQQCRATLEPLASAKDEQPAKTLAMLGNCLDQLGERAKAIETYRRGLAIAPDDSGLLFNLAISIIQMQKLDEGRELLKHDVEKNPSHASAHLILGQVFEEQGFAFPATLSYLHFLALEPATQRSGIAAARLQGLLGFGVKKTKGGVNITIDANPREDEGDYGPMQMMLSIVAGGAMAEEKKSEFEKLQGQVVSVLAIFIESDAKGHTDFTERVQRPFFASMEKAKATQAFAAVALAPLKLPGTVEWAKTHEKDIDRYFDWIRPQLQRPAVILTK